MRRGRFGRMAALVLLLCAMLTTAAAASYTKLRYRDTGTEVLRLQQALNQLGYSTGGADGKFGTATEKAVRQFQRDQGLDEDGVAGDATQSRLYKLAGGVVAPSTTAPSQSGSGTGLFGGNYATLKYGSRGDRVKTLQSALNQLGFSAGTVDGRFGLGTQVAVVAFQKSAGLSQDGKAGRGTLTAIERAISGEQTVTPAPSTGTAPTPTPTPSSGSGTVPTRTLRLGMTGDDVKSVQSRLQALGYYAGSLDGKYGSGTLSAMQAFQSNNGLVVDGKAGTNTYAKLFSNNAVPAYATPAPGATATPTPFNGWIVPTRVLRKGYTGEDVRSVQNRLKALGYYTGTVDGKYGTGTLAAVQAFQAKNGLTTDGKAGTATNARLFSNSALAADAVTATPTPAPVTPTPSPSPTATWNVPTRTLRIGDQGSDVSDVQNRLKELGYYTGAVDSKYGSGTVAAVLAFQSKHGLTQDGVAGSGTYTRLFSASALRADAAPTSAPTTTVHPTLRVGDQGSEVTKMQSALKQLKYTITVNGTYDQQTKTAVTSFQRLNGLGVDGVAGPKTLAVLYSSSAVTGDTQFTTPAPVKATEVPSTSQLKLMHWYNEVKPVLKGQRSIYVYEPASGYGFTLHLYSLGRHADVEPMTAQDTANMMAAWGNKVYWEPVKFVYVKLPNGVWTVATMHNVAHGGQSIKTNNFDGQNCIHFLRDMSEAEEKDPSYGVKNQKALRSGWKALTGETVN